MKDKEVDQAHSMEFGIIFYDEDNVVGINLEKHTCSFCSKEKIPMSQLPHVYGLTVCTRYYSEALAQLQKFNVKILAVVSYTVTEELKTYTTMRVKGDVRYFAGLL